MLWLFRGQLWLLLLSRAAAAPSLLCAANSLNLCLRIEVPDQSGDLSCLLLGTRCVCGGVGLVCFGHLGGATGKVLACCRPPTKLWDIQWGYFCYFGKPGGGSKGSFPPYLAQESIGRFPGGPSSPTWCPPSMSGFQSSLCRPAGSPPGPAPGPTVEAQSTLSRLVPPSTWRGPPGCSDPALGALPRAAGLSAQGSPRPTRIPPCARTGGRDGASV